MRITKTMEIDTEGKLMTALELATVREFLELDPMIPTTDGAAWSVGAGLAPATVREMYGDDVLSSDEAEAIGEKYRGPRPSDVPARANP